MNRYSSLVLRTGIAIVFLWFGFSQLKNPGEWTGMIPEYISSISVISIINLIYLNGLFEVIFATLLLVGFFTRLSAILLTLHLLHITTIVGYGAIGVRDFALTLATLSIFLNGADEFCLDNLLSKKEN